MSRPFLILLLICLATLAIAGGLKERVVPKWGYFKAVGGSEELVPFKRDFFVDEGINIDNWVILEWGEKSLKQFVPPEHWAIIGASEEKKCVYLVLKGAPKDSMLTMHRDISLIYRQKIPLAPETEPETPEPKNNAY